MSDKVLWRKDENYQEDNDTNGHFLEQLILNDNIKQRQYKTVVLNTAAVSQQICYAAIVCCVYVYLQRDILSTGSLVVISIILLITSYIFCIVVGGHLLCGSVKRGVRQLALLVTGVFLMSPILSTLTSSICEDTIVTSTTFLKLMHVLLHDYNFVNSLTDGFGGSISLACGVAGTLLLASRLQDNNEVFGYVLFCLEIYLLLPYVRRYLRQVWMKGYLYVCALLCIFTTALVGQLSCLLGVFCAISLISICFLAPYVLIKMHKFKAKINGPWDEAVPIIPKVVNMYQTQTYQT